MREEIREKINEGSVYMSASNYEAAAEAFARATQEEPSCEEAYEHLGNALASLKRYDESIKAFKTALMLKPGDGSIYFSIGSVYFLKDEYREAVKYLNRAEEAGQKSVGLYLLRSGIYERNGDRIQAIREISRAIDLEPLRADLYKRKTLLQVENNNTDGALETLEELREVLPDALAGYEMAVLVHCVRKEYEKADEIAEKGLRLFPKDPAMYLLKVQIVSQSGQYEQVEKWAAKLSGMELDPQARTQLTVYRAEAFGRQENMTRMQEVLEEHYQKWKDPEVMYLLMMFYSGQKEYGRLKGLAGQLKEMDVKDSFRAAAQFAYAEAVEHMDGKEAAEELYQKMTKDFRKLTIANPTLYEVYIYRLLSHCAVGEYEKALELADYISNAKPGLSDGHLYKAYVLEKAGRGQEAKEERRKAQTAAPARQ